MPRKPFRRRESVATCPACGNSKAAVVQRVQPLHEPDIEGTFKDEITQCDACGEELFTFEQAEASARSYTAAVARARNSFTPERIYDLRLTLGLSQAQMEKAFGLGPKTWGRWERGFVAPSGPAARLMWIAENDTSIFLRMVDAHRKDRERSTKIVGGIAQLGPGQQAVAFRSAEHVASKRVRSNGGNATLDDGDSV
jgi:putative zinc finger/helix-turn-helix YgiT family protein